MKIINFTTGKEVSLSNEESTCAKHTPSTEECVFDEDFYDMPAFIFKSTYWIGARPTPPIQKHRGQVMEKEQFAIMMKKFFARNKN